MFARPSNGLRVFIALVGTSAVLAPGLVSGCGSSSSPTAPVKPAPVVDASIRLVTVVTAGGGAGSSSGDSGGNPLGDLPDTGMGSSSGGGTMMTGSSSGADDGSADDGTADGEADAAPPPVPNCTNNYVAPPCGMAADGTPTTCDLRSNTCCITISLAERCIPGANAKCNSNEAAVHCSNACDCFGGNVCCGVINTLVGAVQTICQDIPDGGLCNPHPPTNTQASGQLCTTDGECKNGQGCIHQTCELGATLNVCGLQSQDPFNCMATTP